MATLHKFPLPIKSEQALKDFLRLALGVVVPDVQVCPNHTTPWRAFADAYFAKTPVAVWKASRGLGGKTFLLSLLSLTEALTLKADVNLLGGSGQQSKRALEHLGRFASYQNFPKHLLTTDIAQQMRFAYGNTVEALMASQTSVRGPHPQRLRVDEVDEVDLAILDAALGQPMSKNGITSQVVLSSTHQYSDGTMTECLKRAGDKGWSVSEWCFRETLEPHGWLTQEEVERKKSQMTVVSWTTEVELQEPSPGSRAIQPEFVQQMFKRELGEYRGDEHEYIEAEPPVEGATYVTGTDWARKQDWTVIITIRTDCKPARVVAFERTGRVGWATMVGRLNERVNRYQGSAAHDATGVGDAIQDYLTVYSEPVVMVGRDRSQMLTAYISAIEHGELVSPYIQYMESEHRLASVEDVFGGGDKHHLPDTMSAGSLAWRAVGGGIQILFEA